MTELVPVTPVVGRVSNHQRRSCALTIAERAQREHVHDFLLMLGLAEERSDRLVPLGEEDGISWRVAPVPAALAR